MKKLKVLLIIGVMAALLLAGCGKDAKKDASGKSDSADKKAEAESNKPTEPEDSKIYEKFLKGEITAIASDGIEGLTKDKAYTIDEMAQAIADAEGDYYMPNILDKIEYGAVDCGGDGNVEIAVKFTYTNENKDDFAQVMIVLKNFNGTVRALLRTDEYYRSYSTVLSNGLIVSGGSNSAFEHTVEYRSIDADGNVHFITSIDVILGMSACIIPNEYLPELVRSSEFPSTPEICTDDENGYTLEVIKTAEYDWDNYDVTEYYEFSKKHLFFAFADAEDVFQEPDANYAAYYKNKEVNVVAPNEGDTFLDDLFATYGFTSESLDFPEVEWKELDTTK